MVLYKVYTQEYRIRYFANACSTAVVFQILCIVLTFLPPLFSGYFTNGFYYKELTYTEQPNVKFLQKYCIIVDDISSLRFTSSIPTLNNYYVNNYYPSTLKTYTPRDVNGDGISDQQNITIDVILPESFSNKIINIWLFFQYSLNQYPAINMETLGLISLNAPDWSAISTTMNAKATIFGQLNFIQRQPVSSYQTDASIQNPIIDFGTFSIVPSFDDVLDSYSTRNYFTTFNQQYVQWTSTPSSDSTATLTINAVLNTGPQQYRYVPTFWKEFRWSWIQYFTSLLPFFYVANKVKEFVFSNNIVRTVRRKSP